GEQLLATRVDQAPQAARRAAAMLLDLAKDRFHAHLAAGVAATRIRVTQREAHAAGGAAPRRHQDAVVLPRREPPCPPGAGGAVAGPRHLPLLARAPPRANRPPPPLPPLPRR